MADNPTVVVVGGGSAAEPAVTPEPDTAAPAQERKEAIELGAVLESSRRNGETIQEFRARLDAIEARDAERGAQIDRLITALAEEEEEEEAGDVEEVIPEPEPAPAEPEPAPEPTKKECVGWLKPFMGVK